MHIAQLCVHCTCITRAHFLPLCFAQLHVGYFHHLLPPCVDYKQECYFDLCRLEFVPPPVAQCAMQMQRPDPRQRTACPPPLNSIRMSSPTSPPCSRSTISKAPLHQARASQKYFRGKIHPTPPWRRPSIKGAYLEYFPGSKTWRRNNAAGRVGLFVVPRCKIHILEQISGDGHQSIHLVQQVVHLRQIRRMHQIISTLHNPTDNDNELCQTHQDPLKIQMVRRITQWYKCIMD